MMHENALFDDCYNLLHHSLLFFVFFVFWILTLDNDQGCIKYLIMNEKPQLFNLLYLNKNVLNLTSP